MATQVLKFVRERPLGWAFLASVGWILIVIAMAAFATAATIRVLPHEVQFLNSTVSDLIVRDHAGNLIGYMMHNRVSFAGTLLATGLLYIWLGHGPIRRGEAWAWWTLLLSGYAGITSFISYFITDYFDVWHGLGTLGIALTLTIGLMTSYSGLRLPRGIQCIWQKDIFTNWTSAFTIGRLWLSVWALGMMAGGALVLETGVVRIFVPEDLEFMRSTVETLRQISPQVVPFVAHDRIGFGGALVACGLAGLACIWHGLKTRQWPVLGLLGLVWFIRMTAAIGVHPLVGYNNLWHLFPFLLIDVAFGVGCLFIIGSEVAKRP